MKMVGVIKVSDNDEKRCNITIIVTFDGDCDDDDDDNDDG